MNYSILTALLKQNKEYKALSSALLKKFRGKRHPYYISGITDCAENIFLESLSEDLGSADSPLLVIFPDEKKANTFTDFLKANKINAAFFPEREYVFSNITSSHDFESQRLFVLSSLIGLQNKESTPHVICTTAAAVLQITMSPETLGDLCISISYDQSLDTAKLTDRLILAGYQRVDLVDSVGQFAVRGGIIDIFPNSNDPIRIELFGDEIDRIAYFSTETQRFIENIEDEVIITPVKELVLTTDAKEQLENVISNHLKTLKKKASEKDVYSHAVTVMEGELNSLKNNLEIYYADKYLPVIYPEARSALDYITGNVIIMDSSSCKERSDASQTLIDQSLTDITEHYEMPYSVNGDYYKTFESIQDSQNYNTVIVNALTRSANINTDNIYTFNTRHIPNYSNNLQLFWEDLDKYHKNKYLCCVLCSSDNEKTALMAELNEHGYTVLNADVTISEHLSGNVIPVMLMVGELGGGYELSNPRFAVMELSKQESVQRKGRYYRIPKKKKTASEAIMSYADLNVGDFVVHDAYGIGQYLGLQNLTIDGSSRDYVSIKYSGDDKLFLPVDQLDHVSKYIGTGSDTGLVKLSKMGGAEWKHSTQRAKESTREMAKELIELYARRKRTPGIAFERDDDMCRDFAASFEYDETESQLMAIDDITKDMEQPYPMERLLCGDVGYGKTEVALRAAFKAVMSGKQVAVLVPTTILAYQHFQTFTSRMREFPVRVDMLSRFKSKKELEISVRRIQRGDTDIIIGTHRLISKDISFKDLGLIIIDEEQRFGVAQKEKLKKLAVNADILTLTATPIPRTLSMAMGGIVDMSVLEEAPGLRSPVQTYVMEHDDAVINEAIRRELRRGGQVFYLYNNIEHIYSIADKLEKSIPDARIAVAHGRMEKDTIEDIWNDLLNHEIDILVSTTIIETGIDIPSANTLIIENADKYGLSQLHQIRGRVGRSSVRAFAYMTYRPMKQLTEIAQKRLTAIKEYAEFGAGFRIALRDLEIRGAGNLLGAEQHGHLDAIGYDLYMRLLDEAVSDEKGIERPAPRPECSVDVRCDAYLTQSYIQSAPQRMDMYKRIAKIENAKDYDDILDEMCDRYGEPNSQAVNLCRIALIKALGQECQFKKIEEKDGIVKLYTSDINSYAVQKLSIKYPALGVRVMLGAYPYISLKAVTNMRNTEFLIKLLETYKHFIITEEA